MNINNKYIMRNGHVKLYIQIRSLGFCLILRCNIFKWSLFGTINKSPLLGMKLAR